MTTAVDIYTYDIKRVQKQEQQTGMTIASNTRPIAPVTLFCHDMSCTLTEECKKPRLRLPIPMILL